MEKHSATYRTGIAGWEHEILDSCFYLRSNGSSMEKLAYYAQFFDTVEVRHTFWDDELTREDARAWVDAVAANKRFVFNIKLHSSFTHKRHIKPQVTTSTRSMLQELARADRLGTLLAQFPWSFTNTSTNRFHLVKLGEIFRGFPVHVELRHPSWNQPSLLAFLVENMLSPVSADLPRLKQFMPFVTGVVGEHAYVRLHGRNEKGWLLNGPDTRYDYLYNNREIRELARRIDALSEKCKRTTVIFNNTTGGKAVANALQFIAATRQSKSVLIPPATLRAFPYIAGSSAMRPGEQPLLTEQAFRQAV